MITAESLATDRKRHQDRRRRNISSPFSSTLYSNSFGIRERLRILPKLWWSGLRYSDGGHNWGSL